MDEAIPPAAFPDTLISLTASMDLPGFIGDLARLEWALQQKALTSDDPNRSVEAVTVNPSLTLLPVRWKNLAAFIRSNVTGPVPIDGSAHVMIWRHPQTLDLHYREASDIDLLALKLCVEHIDPLEAARLGKVSPGDIQNALDSAISQGLLLSPGSRIRRGQQPVGERDKSLAPFLRADIFTLQWHITQTCDLHCKHCYDRSDRSPMAVDLAMTILDDFFNFCQRMHVRGQVTFTGGNPLLYPHFAEVYRGAAQYGFGIAILGNPSPFDQMRQLVEIAKPLYFQISLEGLKAHNDSIRGKGHFDRSLAFLQQLRDLDIFSMVMLTLTRDNLDQVLPLAELLKDRVGTFTFNRLATVGEGAKLVMPEKAAFESFLRAYATTAAKHPHMGLKDNLFNIIFQENGATPFGGCTGYGCGAAFNFMALLSDGEVHACRKFPSYIGTVKEHRLDEIYNGALAERYRGGSQACRDCSLNLVCRGCLAATYSMGLDVFTNKDPFCFAST